MWNQEIACLLPLLYQVELLSEFSVNGVANLAPQPTVSSIPGSSNTDSLGHLQATVTIHLETCTRRKPWPNDAHDCASNKYSREISVSGMNTREKIATCSISKSRESRERTHHSAKISVTKIKKRKEKKFHLHGNGKGNGIQCDPALRSLNCF